VSIWKKIKIGEMVGVGGTSEKIAATEISKTEEKIMFNGAMWLAIDVWSMEVEIPESVGADSLRSGEYRLPACVDVVEYVEDHREIYKALGYVPKACGPQDWNCFVSPSCACRRDKRSCCPDRYGLCRKFEMDSQLSHHYCQEKISKLTRERGLSTEHAKKLVAWTTFPVNAVMPVDLLLCLVRKTGLAVVANDVYR